MILNIETTETIPVEKNGEAVEEVQEEETKDMKQFHRLDLIDKEASKISGLHSASKVTMPSSSHFYLSLMNLVNYGVIRKF